MSKSVMSAPTHDFTFWTKTFSFFWAIRSWMVVEFCVMWASVSEGEELSSALKQQGARFNKDNPVTPQSHSHHIQRTHDWSDTHAEAKWVKTLKQSSKFISVEKIQTKTLQAEQDQTEQNLSDFPFFHEKDELQSFDYINLWQYLCWPDTSSVSIMAAVICGKHCGNIFECFLFLIVCREKTFTQLQVLARINAVTSFISNHEFTLHPGLWATESFEDISRLFKRRPGHWLWWHWNDGVLHMHSEIWPVLVETLNR